MRWKKDNLQIFTLKKNVLRQIFFLEIVSVTKIKNKLFRCMCNHKKKIENIQFIIKELF